MSPMCGARLHPDKRRRGFGAEMLTAMETEPRRAGTHPNARRATAKFPSRSVRPKRAVPTWQRNPVREPARRAVGCRLPGPSWIRLQAAGEVLGGEDRSRGELASCRTRSRLYDRDLERLGSEHRLEQIAGCTRRCPRTPRSWKNSAKRRAGMLSGSAPSMRGAGRIGSCWAQRWHSKGTAPPGPPGRPDPRTPRSGMAGVDSGRA